MTKTIKVRSSHGYSVETEVLFTGEVKDADGMYFVVSKAEKIAYTPGCPRQSGILIGYGDDDYLVKDSNYWTDALPFTGDDDKKIIASQLRELADWMEKQ